MTNELEPLKECPFCPDGGVVVELKKDGKPTGIVAHYCYTLNREIRVPKKDWNTRYKQTCHVSGDWFPISQTQWRRIDRCSNCGYGFGVSERDNVPFKIEHITELPNFCPQCGFKICGAEVVDG